jgi:hypothetical protein
MGITVFGHLYNVLILFVWEACCNNVPALVIDPAIFLTD